MTVACPSWEVVSVLPQVPKNLTKHKVAAVPIFSSLQPVCWEIWLNRCPSEGTPRGQWRVEGRSLPRCPLHPELSSGGGRGRQPGGGGAAEPQSAADLPTCRPTLPQHVLHSSSTCHGNTFVSTTKSHTSHVSSLFFSNKIIFFQPKRARGSSR